MTTQHQPAVTVLGLGTMGTALAEALLAAGHPTTVWNRTTAKSDPLVAKGAARAANVGEAIAASHLVIACLLDHASVHETLDGDAGQLRGRVLVNLTSGTSAQAEELATWAACHGADYLDGGIMAVPPMIGKPEALLLYSGSPDAFETARPTLDALGESRYLGAEPGRAALYDIALLSGMYGMFMGVLHAFALIRSDGSKAGDFAPMLQQWLVGMSGFAARAAERIDTGDHSRGVVSNLAMQARAFDEILAFASERGISAELLAPLGPLLRQRVADGHGHEDISGIVDFLMTRNQA